MFFWGNPKNEEYVCISKIEHTKNIMEYDFVHFQ